MTRGERGGFWNFCVLCCWLAVAAGFGRAQDVPAQPPAEKTEPSAPAAAKQDSASPDAAKPDAGKDEKKDEDKKDDSPNPAQAIADKTKEVTAQAAEATKKVGQETFVKVRDWETGWVTGDYVGKNRELIALSTKQRTEIYLQETWTTPGPYLKRMFIAGIDQARGTPREWGGGWGGYGKRFGSREGQFLIGNSIAALANAKLKYEPRYDQCKCEGFGHRTRHAILRNFLTYNESERELRPQWGLYAGAFGGGLISTAWKPHPRNALAEGGFAVLGQAGWGALLNLFTEFADDMNRKLGARK